MISYVQHFGFHDHDFRGHMMSHGPVYGTYILSSLVTMMGVQRDFQLILIFFPGAATYCLRLMLFAESVLDTPDFRILRISPNQSART